MVTSISFQGITTGLQTDKLIEAIAAQDGQFVQRLQARQSANTKRSDAMQVLRSNINTLALKLASVSDSLDVGDATKASAAMQTAIDSYNTLIKTNKQATAVSKDSTGTLIKGPLAGDFVTQNIVSSIRVALQSQPIEIGQAKRLSDIGVRTNSDGTLSLNTAEFETAFNTNIIEVKAIITGTDSAKGISKHIQTIAYDSYLEDIRANISDQNRQLDDQILRGQSLLNKRKIALKEQFDRMESIISQLKSASSSLSSLGTGSLF